MKTIRRLSPLIGLVLGGCLPFSGSSDEVARQSSPSGRVDAVLVETNGGATTPFGYSVYIVPNGAPVPRDGEAARLIGAVRNDSAWGVNLRWVDLSHLSVEYRDARDQAIRTGTVTIGADTITILLRSGVVDSAAPGGGMLYNLRARR